MFSNFSMLAAMSIPAREPVSALSNRLTSVLWEKRIVLVLVVVVIVASLSGSENSLFSTPLLYDIVRQFVKGLVPVVASIWCPTKRGVVPRRCDGNTSHSWCNVLFERAGRSRRRLCRDGGRVAPRW